MKCHDGILFRAFFVSFVLGFSFSAGCQISDVVLIRSNVAIGDSFSLNVTVCGAGNVTVYPYLDATQWGAPQTLSLSDSSSCQSTPLLIPAPVEVGEHHLQLALLNSTSSFPTPFVVGLPLMENLSCAISQSFLLIIKPPAPSAAWPSTPLIAMQWEPWFTAHNFHWHLAEAAPLVGYYDSFNVRVATLHAFWLSSAGVDMIMVDWTNNLWNKAHWSERGVNVQELINATTETIKLYSSLRAIGMQTPSISILIALDNGPKEPLQALQEEVDWITENYLVNYSNVFEQFEGSDPLLVLFDGGGLYDPANPIHAPGWTVRLMASQLQSNDLASKGYWSWMDGIVSPVVTQRCAGGSCVNESITITPAFFGAGGWLAPPAYAKRQGATYLAEAQAALEASTEIVIVDQWNEYAGQAEGSTSEYVDIYNSTLGNDMEPTSLTQCGYPRPNNLKCGGWGYRYLNILQATNVGLKEQHTNSTLLAVASPINHTAVPVSFSLHYETFGVRPSAVTASCDGVQIGQAASSPIQVSLEQCACVANNLRTCDIVVQGENALSAFPLTEDRCDFCEPGQTPSPPRVILTLEVLV